MLFEPDGAFLRYVRLGGTEILRGVYAAVRDHNWDTIPPRLGDFHLERSVTGFRLRFRVEHQGGDVDFGWQGELRGDPDGTVRFGFSGVARSSFRRNRIGFCVLHPASCAGQPCTVEHVDGSERAGSFPERISPHQPFEDLRAITTSVDGVGVEVRMEGDVFEMEDQRNWTDASFKTYCTPLGEPFPVDVEAGTKVEQSVTIGLLRPVEAGGEAGTEPVRVTVAHGMDNAVPLPQLGLGLASHDDPLTARERERLRSLQLAHLRVDLELFDPRHKDRLELALAEAEALEVPLEIALFVSDRADEELRALKGALARQRQALVARWLVFHEGEKSTSERWLAVARRHLAGNGVPVYGGTNAYFTELNRERPPTGAIDGVAYSINPQVHAFDDASLVETLAAQRDTLDSARAFAPGVPIAVTPVTLKPRFNPNATGPEPEVGPGELPREVDARQPSLFAAGWTVGSIKYLGEGGADSVTYFETSGWRGVMEREAGSPLPARFRSSPGQVFPLYHVLADVGEFTGGSIAESSSSEPLAVEALALHQGGRDRILVANLSPRTQHVELQSPWLASRVRIKTLHTASLEQALKQPEAFRAEPGLLREVQGGRLELCLAPHTICRIDSEEVTGA